MLKKRLIFTLLYDNGNFMLSRNFRLQNVGDINWLVKNYDFSKISYSIDELIVLDVTRSTRSIEKFSLILNQLTIGCFVPISAGGGISDIDSARRLLRAGADKVVLNSVLFEKNEFINELASEFGKQCVVASIDIKKSEDGEYKIYSKNGIKSHNCTAKELIAKICSYSVGEIYLNSMDRDGTGQGLNLELLDLLPKEFNKPVILAGGAGNSSHLLEALQDPRVDAVATANLFNFIGNGLRDARKSLVSSGIVLPMWDHEMFTSHLINDGKSL